MFKSRYITLLIFFLTLASIRVVIIFELSATNFFLTQNFLFPIIIGLAIDYRCYHGIKVPKWLIYFITFLSFRALFHISNYDIVILFTSLMVISNVLVWLGKNTLGTFFVSFWLVYNYDSSFIGLLDVVSHNVLSYLIIFSFIIKSIFHSFKFSTKSHQIIILGILASCYFSAFISKFIMPDNSFLNYLAVNDMSNLITAAVINRSNILPVSLLYYLKPFIGLLKVSSLIIEFIWIFVFWFTFNQKKILMALTLTMHVMIYLTTGILFSQWIVLLIIMLFCIENIKPSRRIKSYFAFIIICISVTKIGPGPYLGWLDSKCIISYDFISENNIINRNAFMPFSLPLTQNRMQRFIDDERVNVKSTYGSASNAKELNFLNTNCNTDLYLKYKNSLFLESYQKLFIRNIAKAKKKQLTPSHITDTHNNFIVKFPIKLIREKYYITEYLRFEKLSTDTLKIINYEDTFR